MQLLGESLIYWGKYNIRDLGLDISINNILYGNSDFEHDVNCSLFAVVRKYILDTKRFV
jgi:hypothetical protein